MPKAKTTTKKNSRSRKRTVEKKVIDHKQLLFQAVERVDLMAVRASLAKDEGRAHANSRNQFNLTPLHVAAMSAGGTDASGTVYSVSSAAHHTIACIIKDLVDAGANLEAHDNFGRTPLFLCMEHSSNMTPVQALLDAGADPTATTTDGFSILSKARTQQMAHAFSELTGVTLAAVQRDNRSLSPPRTELSAMEWLQAEQKIASIFSRLSTHLVCVEDAGLTQSDGLRDCMELLENHYPTAMGCCFYTRQDVLQGKRTGEMYLAFAARKQSYEVEVGNRIVTAFRQAGMSIQWNGSPRTRPRLFLKEVEVNAVITNNRPRNAVMELASTVVQQYQQHQQHDMNRSAKRSKMRL